MTLPLAHAAHHIAYGIAIGGIVALFAYDWRRQRHRRRERP
jgi:hypothetical protein